MKRSLLDITQKISRKVGKTTLIPIDLNNSIYWIFEATNYRFVDILPEIQYRTTQDRIKITINTQSIGNRDFIVEQGVNGLLVKFIKARFEYSLDGQDEIVIKGDIESYA
jgi:hypothetical protein